jgi:hypothetical protein
MTYRFFMFGGHDIREGSLSNLWMLDFNKLDDLAASEEEQEKSCEWKLVELKGRIKLGPIAHHSSVVYGDKMYLFGGSNLETENKRFLQLDLRTFEWSQVVR